MTKKVKITAVLSILAAIGTGYLVFVWLDSNSTLKADQKIITAETSKHRVPVVLTPVEIRNFEESLAVQGNLEALKLALIPARKKGTIEEIYVNEGDDVIAGKTKLFRVDSLKLQEALEICRQDLTVARCSLIEKKALLERIEADMHQALNEYKRSGKLLKQHAESAQSYERSESRYKQSLAQRKHAQALVDLAREQVNQAQSKLKMAEKDLQDTLVVAPINGKVSQRFQEPGEMGEPGKPVFKIEDPTVIEVSAFLPDYYYTRIDVGKTRMRIQANGVDIEEQIISYKSPSIDPKLRTFEVKSVITNPPQGVVPGAMSQIEVILNQSRALGVPTSAIQRRADTTVVFVAKEDRAHMVRVRTGLENDGWTQIKSARLSEGTPVVSMGQFLLNEGTVVAVQREES